MDDKQKAKKRQVLGRGLGALLDDAPAISRERGVPEAHPLHSISDIPLDLIETNPFQPRTDFHDESLNELAESIRVQGIIQPITVRRLSSERYQLISGERRYHASKKAGLMAIPAYIRSANDQQMLEMALIENIQRENLNAIEIALSYQRLISECDLRQEDLGDRVGKKRSTITNYLRLLKLPPDIQAGIRDERISMGHARAILALENIDLQLLFYHKTVNEELSVRRLEEMIRKIQQSTEKPVAGASKGQSSTPYEIVKIQERLSSHLGTKVTVNHRGDEKGDIRIPYHSVDDLNRILEIINP